MKTFLKHVIVFLVVLMVITVQSATIDTNVIDDSAIASSVDSGQESEVTEEVILEGSDTAALPAPKKQKTITTKDDITFFSKVTIGKDEIRYGDLVIFGSKADLEGSLIGDLVVIGGMVTVSGHVKGDVVSIGGKIILLPDALIDGELVAVGSYVDQDPSAEIKGDAVSVGTSGIGIGSKTFVPQKRILFRLSLLLTWVVVAFLTVLLFPRSIEKTVEVAIERPAQAALAGFLFHVGALMTGLALTVIIIGIPLAGIGALLWVITGIFGATAGFVLMGKLIMKGVRYDNSRLVVLFFIGFLALALIRQAPWLIGWSIWQIWGMIGIGGTLLSRFGTNKPWFGVRQEKPDK